MTNSRANKFGRLEPQELKLCWGGRFSGTRDVDWHQHAETELVLVTAGHCQVIVDEHELDGPVGTLFVLPATRPQYQRTQGACETTFVGFCAPPSLFDESPRVMILPADDPLRQWLEQLCDWPQVHPPMSREIIRQLLEISLRRVGEIDETRGLRAKTHPAVRRATAHIERNLQTPLELGQLAERAGVSPSHLVALFAEHCGISPIACLQQRRLDRAVWLLDNPYLRIQEVATACGYEDLNYFVRLFKRRFGLPPGRWRKSRINSPKPS